MANLSYCRYRNTLSDLHDCFDDMVERNDVTSYYDGHTVEGFHLSDEEKLAQKRLIALCREIVELGR